MIARAVDDSRAEARFFVLRTPLLPWDQLAAWSDGLAAPQAAADGGDLEAALAADRALLRRRLDAVTRTPAVAEALWLASPSLVEGLDAWRRDPESRKGQRAEQALVRYFARIAGRPTPYGLFAGTSIGWTGDATAISLAPQNAYRRASRLDMDFLVSLAEALAALPDVRRQLVVRPSSSLHLAGGRWRYVETRPAPHGGRSHHLVAAEPSEALDELLTRAAGGLTQAALADHLAAWSGGEVTCEEAMEFVEEVTASGLLVADLVPPATGEDAGAVLARALATTTAHHAGDALAAARRALAGLDRRGPGADPAAYAAIAAEMADMPVSAHPARLAQVDLVKPLVVACLGTEILDQLRLGVALLHRLCHRPATNPLARFREDFLERWSDGQEVPLAFVLDEDVGIGFARSTAPGAGASPLIAGLPFAGGAGSRSWGSREQALLELAESSEEGEPVELGDAWVERLAEDAPPPLPDAFHVIAAIAAASPEDIAHGRFQVLFDHASGPSGVRLLSRFCHALPELVPELAAHLAAEEALRPDGIFAEVVHLPEGRLGNVVHRPVLRGWEIPFLGRSAAPPERQLPISDLTVTVVGDEIELRSRRLGRRVQPCLTSAHNFDHESVGLYRFLCTLQGQGLAAGVTWSWGPLEGAAFTPRVTRGRLVLARARWRVAAAEINHLAGAREGARYRRALEWRRRRRVPRWVLLVEGDRHLPIDLDNPLSLDALLDHLATRSEAVLSEVFPPPDALCVRGPEGCFVHELVVPFVHGGRPSKRPTVPRPRPVIAVRRSFAPGSEWLYAKLYGGEAGADRALVELAAPWARQAIAAGVAERWFFLRYGDPHPHLRVRLQGDPRRLHAEAHPALVAGVREWLDDGRLWRLELGTYEREVERYGGPEAIAAAERLFAADSEAAVDLLAAFAGEAGAEVRWLATLLGIDRLFTDLEIDLTGRRALSERLAAANLRLLGGGKPMRFALDRRFRERRAQLEDLLWGEAEGLAPVRRRFTERSAASAAAAAEIVHLADAGRLAAPISDVAANLAHMNVNRLIRSSARAHELALFDLLARLYASKQAREASVRPRARAPRS